MVLEWDSNFSLLGPGSRWPEAPPTVLPPLSNEFGLKNEGNTEIASLLGQLKQVNHWLDNLAGGDKVDHRVEKLRKNLYRFLLEHVNSAVTCN